MKNDPRAFVTDYFDTKGIKINERGDVFDGKGRNRKTIFNTMYLDYVTTVEAHNTLEKQKSNRVLLKPIPKDLMEMAVEEIIEETKKVYKEALVTEFTKYVPNDQIMKDFVKAIIGTESEDEIAVMKHWMWQVKKKMLGEFPTYHIMPVFFGKQGGGKTRAINRLIAPIENYRLDISMKEAADPNCFAAMSDNFVVVFDEMEGAVKADIEALKKQITADYNNYRVLHKQYMLRSRQSCSFIGATNRPVGQQILDSTGMRRFFEFKCLDVFDWKVLEAIDYNALWASIDVTKVDGYIVDRLTSISQTQQELVSEDEISAYLSFHGIVADKTPTKRVFTGDLYNLYKEWATENGYRPMNVSNFGKQLKGKGFTGGKARDGKSTHNYINVNHDFVLPTPKPWENPLDQSILKVVK